MDLTKPSACLLREVSDRFDHCLRSTAVSIDVELARRQHATYRRLIEERVEHVVVLASDPAHPDCCYIEDTAVVIRRHAVLTRPGTPSRLGEVSPVGEALARWCHVHRMQPPATLDGGDVMRVGATLYAGLSARTNPQGVAFLRDIARKDGVDVVAVPVKSGLHLKSGCTVVDRQTVIYDPGVLDPSLFAIDGAAWIPAPEPVGANVLPLGDAVLVSNDAPTTAGMLSQMGYRIETVDVSELHKGDGALTCLSIRIPGPGGWSA